jgi:hypothetical protein
MPKIKNRKKNERREFFRATRSELRVDLKFLPARLVPIDDAIEVKTKVRRMP